MTERVFVGPRTGVRGTAVVPGDKSLSHRALLLAAMAPGTSHLSRLSPGHDVASTGRCLDALGVEIAGSRVVSAGVAGWIPPGHRLDAGNSGSTLRMLAGAVAGRPFVTSLGGDASLNARPMRRLVQPLEALGARIETTPTGTAPVTVHGASLRGADVVITVASAQVRTAFALAALQADGPSTIDSPPDFRDHTERWLSALGRGVAKGPTAFIVHPGPVAPLDIVIPGDTSSAAFLWAAAALGASTVTTPGVSLNPGRTGFLDVLALMGAVVEITITGEVLGDPRGDVTVTGPVTTGIRVAGSLAQRAIDELPLVGVLATLAEGETVVADAHELRAKESDRIAATVGLVTALGGRAEATPDGFVVRASHLHPGRVDAAGDHRLAMTAAVAATRAGSVRVAGFEVASVSWPGFAEVLEGLWSSQ